MTSILPKCRITVLKKTLHDDLAGEYLEEEYGAIGPCDRFEEGEEFTVDPEGAPGEFFARCPYAWADISKDILAVAYGCDMPGIKYRGTLITGCTDWFRPVIFKVERVDE
ncbi:MAG: TIGR04076 family protein [Actinomycetota bacterium]|nr:TIGR04076 family protein [Actinomycetota bacterium]